jgi:hypothetical protein
VELTCPNLHLTHTGLIKNLLEKPEPSEEMKEHISKTRNEMSAGKENDQVKSEKLEAGARFTI